jgi:hypothetical protein
MLTILFFFFKITTSFGETAPPPLLYDHFEDQSDKRDQNIISYRESFSPLEDYLNFEEENQTLMKDLNNVKKELKKIKYHLINGNTKMAGLFIDKLIFENSSLKPVIYRYLANILFINGNYAQSLSFLDSIELTKSPHYAKICFLKVMNKIIINKLDHLKTSWDRCRLENYKKINLQTAVWIDLIIELKTERNIGITEVPFRQLKLAVLTVDELKSILKFALYFNQEKLLLEELSELTFDQLRDLEVRELVGHIFYRQRLFSKSFPFIEDLKTPNAETIKGNLYILREKYELAYAQFKLTYQEKNNSMNALERLAPLAWTLSDWEKGAFYSEKLITPERKYFHKLTLKNAFLIQAGNLDEAYENILLISNKTKLNKEVQISQMKSFLAVMKNDQKMLMAASKYACEQFDLSNCWLVNQALHWENMHYVVKKEGNIIHQKIWKELTKEEISDPLREKIYVDQKDIEELDEKEELEQSSFQNFNSEV